jgi:hypothetical protein
MTVSVTNNSRHGPVKIYRLSISGSTASVVGTTRLRVATQHHSGQSWIEGNTVVGIYGQTYKNLALWPYPKGGSPTLEIKNVATRLFGVAVTSGS